jgi:hypothetical protein
LWPESATEPWKGARLALRVRQPVCRPPSAPAAAGSDEERLKIFSDMKKPHYVRSDYVHGGDAKPKKVGSLPEDVRRYRSAAGGPG